MVRQGVLRCLCVSVLERLGETCQRLEDLAGSGKERLRFEWFVWWLTETSNNEYPISNIERFAQQNLTPVPFFRGVACVLDCGNE
ncbi:hypothetical protein ES705_19388 [subsurface metagenome]